MFACKANTNIAIMKLIKSCGIKGIDAVSLGEIKIALAAGFAPLDIQFTANFVNWEELKEALAEGVLLCIGELDTLDKIGQHILKHDIKGPVRVAIRVNPDVGSGECEATITGGPKSKFGVYCD